ncbi:MAG TPA: superoxide dismutase [Candidatus Thermoplasmatota archaeon]|nr:superoxide dismutase [Candidatus Thermoplasmatota archaeon]
MTFKLPDLPYAHDALEPAVDKTTMEIHHGRHHKAYVDNLNKALEGKNDWSGKSIEELCRRVNELPADIKGPVRNNGGGHYNHSLFWEIMAPKGKGGSPSGDLARAIDADLGGMEKLKAAVSDAGMKRFGSGWAWIIVNAQGKLEVTSTPNQDNPLMQGLAEKTGTPILGVDVWEHAYYLKYQNKRADYLAAWWDVVNWSKVSELYASARKQ